MRTLLAALCLYGAALGGAVEVEGEKVTLDAKELPAPEPVEVVCEARTGVRGPQAVALAVGRARSRLPHEWFDVTVRVELWLSYKDKVFPQGCMGLAGSAQVECKRLKPMEVRKFALFLRDKDGVPVGVNFGHKHYLVVKSEFTKSEMGAKE